MGYLAAPFRWIDGIIQKGVDSTAFFFMRRFGWRKSFLKYALMGVVVMSCLSPLVGFIKDGEILGIMMVLFFTFIYLKWQYRDYSSDKRDEEKNVMYTASDMRWIRAGKFYKIISSFFIVNDLFIMKLRGINLAYFSLTLFSISILLLAYLAKTPNILPPPKEETASDLVPQLARIKK